MREKVGYCRWIEFYKKTNVSANVADAELNRGITCKISWETSVSKCLKKLRPKIGELIGKHIGHINKLFCWDCVV